MEIRRLSLSDLNSYFDNRLRALENSPSAFRTTLAEERARGNNHIAQTLSHQENDAAIFGALDQGLVVDTIGIRRGDSAKTRHKATIWGVYVDESHRRKGICGRLVDLAILFAKEQMRVAVVNLTVESTNQGARKLYESRGFISWGTEPMAMQSLDRYEDEDHMVLKL